MFGDVDSGLLSHAIGSHADWIARGRVARGPDRIVRIVRAMHWAAPLLIAAGLWAPGMSSAQLAGVTTHHVNIRAGPDRSFPLVSWLPAGSRVHVIGCIDGWRWCDVAAGRNRGWVFARYLSTSFHNRPTVVYNSGAMMGVPQIGFSVNTYWGAHYRNRPWWNERNDWARRPQTWNRPPQGRPPKGRPPTRG